MSISEATPQNNRTATNVINIGINQNNGSILINGTGPRGNFIHIAKNYTDEKIIVCDTEIFFRGESDKEKLN